MPTYEAIYEDGQLEWIGDEPAPGRHRVQVRVLDSDSQKHNRKDVRRMLERTRGAWGTDKTLEEVEEEVQKLRNEWDRLERD
jgi:hypothetical protein